jgi:hypothetical protein
MQFPVNKHQSDLEFTGREAMESLQRRKRKLIM